MGDAVGRTKDAGWEIGVSRTLPHPPEAVWQYLTSADGIATWLGAGAVLAAGAPYRTDDGVTGEVRSRHENDRVRLTWQPAGGAHESTVQVTVSASNGKTVLRFHQERLRSSAEREQQREHWRAVLHDVTAALG